MHAFRINQSFLNSSGGRSSEMFDFIHGVNLSIFYFILVLILCVVIIHALKSVLQANCCLPESIIFVFIGACMGMILILIRKYYPNISLNSVTPTFVFVVLIPPIIFESGYNIHKKYFLENFGSIVTFAVLGTVISCVFVSLGIYFCGYLNLTVKLTLRECFAFGALISATDPVATLAVFSALDVDKVLYMLVFGESVLNDAVAISLVNAATTVPPHPTNGLKVIGQAALQFTIDFIGSALIGITSALASSLLLKLVNLRKIPPLELMIVLLCSYAPYCLADAVKLSGICALLFAGITMSQYTQLNLSPITKITAQQVFRTISFMAEASLFIYLGLAIFIFEHNFQITMVLWTVFFCLLGRVMNIFPLSFILNRFRKHQISLSSQFMMWFSGLRGAIAFALSLLLDFDEEKQKCIVSTTLTVVLITIVIFGGTSVPLISIMNSFKKSDFRAKRRGAGADEVHALFVDWANIEANMRANKSLAPNDRESKASEYLTRFNADYLVPIFSHRFTSKELQDGWKNMTSLMEEWYTSVRSGQVLYGDDEGDSDESEEREQLLKSNTPDPLPKSQYTIRINGYNTASDLKSEIHFVQPIRKTSCHSP